MDLKNPSAEFTGLLLRAGGDGRGRVLIAMAGGVSAARSMRAVFFVDAMALAALAFTINRLMTPIGFDAPPAD